jgi:predicted RNA-binding Zn ribbon-like protein
MQAFINTHFDLVHDHGTEVLHSPSALHRWLCAAALLNGEATLTDADLSRALTTRESLRSLAAAAPGDPLSRNAALAGVDRMAAGTRVEVRFDREPPWFAPAPDAGLDGAMGALLAIVAQAIADGSWSRLKICPGHHCGWAFYDGSRNRTGRWCSMSVCGGRVKAKRHYRNRRVEEG